MNFGFGSMMTGRFTGFDVYYEFVLSKFRCKKKEKKLMKIEKLVNPILGMKKISNNLVIIPIKEDNTNRPFFSILNGEGTSEPEDNVLPALNNSEDLILYVILFPPWISSSSLGTSGSLAVASRMRSPILESKGIPAFSNKHKCIKKS